VTPAALPVCQQDVCQQDLWMTCGDGTRLASRLWRPGGPGSWPVLLMRQPYGRAIASTITYAHPSWYAAQGFVVVVQDVRGQGDSEGHFGGFDQEAADGAEAVRWARGLAWANGRLGSYGFSYQGLSQLLNAAAESDPTALPDCLAPAMAGASERDHWASEGGAHWWALGLAWGLQLAALQCRRRGDDQGWSQIRRSLESQAFLREGMALLAQHDPQGMALGWLQRDPGQELGWRRHPISTALLRQPMLLIGGWYDPHLRGVLDLWRRCLAAGGQPLLRIGAWTHLDWRGGIDELQLAFFRRHLQAERHPQAHEPGQALGPGEALALGSDLGPGQAFGPGQSVQMAVDSPLDLASDSPLAVAVAVQCQSSGSWLREPFAEQPYAGGAWPVGHYWGLASGGLAAVRADEGQLVPGGQGHGRVEFVHDPWRPVPGRGGHLGLDAGPCDRADLDGRCDVVCFTSPPLAESLALVGQPELLLAAGADQASFDLAAALAVVSGDGQRVCQLATGFLRVYGQAGPDQSAPLLRLSLQPLAARLEAGEALRLSLAGAAWPQISVNPGDGSLPLGGCGSHHRVITICLELVQAQLRLVPIRAGAPASN
jgi:predicted acyl esterase